ncbi:MAG: AbrB/MazE/SpoVT family DNA-binding domain-containing protein [Candidatus Binatia bacterium]
MPLVRVKQKFQVTIPDNVRRRAGLEVGDMLEAKNQGKVIILKPKAVVDREVEDAIREGLKDIEEGRVFGPFSSVKEFKKALKKR